MINLSVKIAKIILDYDGKRIELTEEQARGLHRELDRLFNNDKTYVYPYPYWIKEPYYPIDRYEIVWDSTSYGGTTKNGCWVTTGGGVPCGK